MHERERSVSTHMGNLLAIPHGSRVTFLVRRLQVLREHDILYPADRFDAHFRAALDLSARTGSEIACPQAEVVAPSRSACRSACGMEGLAASPAGTSPRGGRLLGRVAVPDVGLVATASRPSRTKATGATRLPDLSRSVARVGPRYGTGVAQPSPVVRP